MNRPGTWAQGKQTRPAVFPVHLFLPVFQAFAHELVQGRARRRPLQGPELQLLGHPPLLPAALLLLLRTIHR